MSDFKAKMHPIRFPPWGIYSAPLESLQHSPRPLAVFKGLLLRGGRGKWERRE